MVSRAPAVRGWLVVLVAGVLAGVLVLAVTDVAGVGLLGGGAGRHAPGPVRAVADRATDRAPGESRPARIPAVEVLHGWDRDRAAAWAAGDPRALARLYVAGSRAGAADVALLRRYLARGLVVTGMRRQVLGVRVVAADADRVRLVVTDRLVGARARPRDDGRAVALPASRPRTRDLALRRADGRWRMVRVGER